MGYHPRMSEKSTLCIAIVGAAGAVGREMIAILESHDLGAGELRLFGQRSAGQRIEFRGQDLAIQALSEDTIQGVDIALFSAGANVSKQYAPWFVRGGTVVVDNSSAFRADPNCPLVIPEVNPDALSDITPGRGAIVANPNCSTIIMLLAANPIHRQCGVKRLIVSTYQAASGAGQEAMHELENQSRDVLAGKPAQPRIFTEPCAFNVFSHNTPVDEHGFNGEEAKMRTETRRIWNDPSIHVHATCIRVPVMRAHCESIHLTLNTGVRSVEEARAMLAQGDGVQLADDRAANAFPTPLKASGKDDVLVGRLRLDESMRDPDGRCRGVSMFVAGDQLRKGAALNAIQIAQRVFSPVPTDA